MLKKLMASLGLLAISILILRLAVNVQAAPAGQLQQFQTPTPGADGRIIYIVKANDTCSLISLLTGVSEDYLRQTNHLGENCIVFEGQQLVIGYGNQVTPSATPVLVASPTSIVPSPTPFYGNAQVCVSLYNDANGDGLRQANLDEFDAYIASGTEPIIPGGAVSLTSLDGVYSQTLTTLAGLDPVCFTDAPEGSYTVSAAVPDGYNPTTALTYQLTLKAGDQAFVDFGAQSRESASQSNQVGGKTPLLGILGGIVLLSGIGLGIYAFRMKK